MQYPASSSPTELVAYAAPPCTLSGSDASGRCPIRREGWRRIVAWRWRTTCKEGGARPRKGAADEGHWRSERRASGCDLTRRGDSSRSRTPSSRHTSRSCAGHHVLQRLPRGDAHRAWHRRYTQLAATAARLNCSRTASTSDEAAETARWSCRINCRVICASARATLR